jgi:hypothetical protein
MSMPQATRPASPTAATQSLRLTLAALVLGGGATALAFVAACSSDSGTTPTCIQDDDDAGHHIVDGGCHPHAVCTVNGVAASPLTCCAGLASLDLASCLSGYDAVCADSSGKAIDPKTCCAAFIVDGGSDSDFCLHGYGAQCLDPAGSGQVVDASQCCPGLSGRALQFCMYAYGGPLPGNADLDAGDGGG